MVSDYARFGRVPSSDRSRRRRNRAAELLGLDMPGNKVRPDLAFEAGASYESKYIEATMREHPTWTVRVGSGDPASFVILRDTTVLAKNEHLVDALQEAEKEDER